MAPGGRAARRGHRPKSGTTARGVSRAGVGRSSWLRHSGMVIGAGIAAFVISLVGFALLAEQRGSGAPSDFSFEVYQGAGVLDGPDANFADVLSMGKPVVLNFWAGDCPPCRFEMPDLQRSYEAHGDEVIYLGIDVGVFTGLGSRQSALALLNELNITYPSGAPPDRTAVVDYRVTAMPTTVFIDAGGEIVDRWEGAITESQLEGILSGMLQ